MDVLLFVLLARTSGNESEMRSTYAGPKTRLPADSRLRIRLGGAIEEYLVDDRRYVEAVEESDRAVIDYYLDLFRSSRNDERVKPVVVFTIANECGAHYEALLGVGHYSDADDLAEQLIEYAPTAQTLAALIHRARRAGALEATTRLQGRAQTMGLTLPPETSVKRQQ
jgi:hypothetical protein